MICKCAIFPSKLLPEGNPLLLAPEKTWISDQGHDPGGMGETALLGAHAILSKAST